MSNKIIIITEEMGMLTDKKVYHAPAARIVNIFGNRLMQGEVNWGEDHTIPGQSGDKHNYTGGVPGDFTPGEGTDPDDDYAKGAGFIKNWE